MEEKDTIKADDVGELRVEEGVLTVVSSRDAGLAQRIENAMNDAVQACLAHGVSPYDAETIIAAKMAARERVLNPPKDDAEG